MVHPLCKLIGDNSGERKSSLFCSNHTKGISALFKPDLDVECANVYKNDIRILLMLD